MTFDEIMEQARVGDLVFFSGRKLFSRLIQFRSGSEWSHVAVVILARNKELGIEPQIVESLEGVGVRSLPLAEWRSWNGKVALGRVSLFANDRRAIADYAASKVGGKYASHWQFLRSFSLIWSRIHRLFGIPDDRDRSRYFCSELAAESLEACSRYKLLPKSPSQMYPSDVASLSVVSLFDDVEVPA